jgi:hypothetical protein
MDQRASAQSTSSGRLPRFGSADVVVRSPGGAASLSGGCRCWELKQDCLSDVGLGYDTPSGGESVDKLEAAAALGEKVERGSQH